MSANHEPGPWVIQRPRPRQNRMFVRPKFGVGVAIAQICQRTNRDANAALIAAAPELLAEAIADDGLAVFIERTLAAVALPSGHPEVSRAFADIRGALASRGALRRAAIAKAEGSAS